MQNPIKSPKISSDNQSLNGFVFSGYKIQQHKLGKYAIELDIDSNDAFDYENPENAKYSVD